MAVRHWRKAPVMFSAWANAMSYRQKEKQNEHRYPESFFSSFYSDSSHPPEILIFWGMFFKSIIPHTDEIAIIYDEKKAAYRSLIP